MIVSEKPRIELIEGDCHPALKAMEDNQYDLAIVDPPTGQGEGKNHVSRPYDMFDKRIGKRSQIKRIHTIKNWDNKQPDQEYFDELFRVSKHQIIMCLNQLRFLQKDLSTGRIVWNLLRKNDFSDCQIMYNSMTNKIDYVEYMWNGAFQGKSINSRKSQGDKRKCEKRIHPSQKPIRIYKWILKKYGVLVNNVLDTHLGSGSIIIACFEMGINLTAFEKDKFHFKAAVERFQKHIAQKDAFKENNINTYGEQLEI